VKKIPYSLDARTRLSISLHVSRNFSSLVISIICVRCLEEFASTMAYQVGGREGINKAIECNNNRDLRILIGIAGERPRLPRS